RVPEASPPVSKQSPNSGKRVEPASAPVTPAPVKETPAKSALPEKESVLADDDIHMKQVQSFVQGTWFELKLDKDEMTRCRLAAYIRPTGKYIFVNRNNMKVAEKSQQEL